MKRKSFKGLLHLYAAGVYLFLLSPVIVVLLSSLTTTSYVVFPPKGLTLHWYKELLGHQEFIDSFLLSVGVAGFTTLISTILGTLTSLAVVRYEFKGKEVLTNFLGSPMVIPTVVFGTALLQYFSRIGIAAGPLALVLGHIILTVPYVMRLVVASLTGFNRSIEQAAMNLGAKPLQVFFKITLPVIKSGIIAGAVFAFITSFDDLTVALFIVSTDVVTLPVRIFSYIQYQYDPIITSLSSMIILLTIILIFVIERVFGVGRLFDVKKKEDESVS
jgi:putative spermidine/putrescine transport system permease protein